MWLKLGSVMLLSIVVNANGRVNHTEAQADKLSNGQGGSGGGVMRRILAVGMQDGWSFCCFRLKQGGIWNLERTYPKLFHLFFLQARGVKIEVWLKHKFKVWGGGEEEETTPCEVHATKNKQDMIGDVRTPDIWHLPTSTWTLCGLTTTGSWFIL